MCKGRIFCLFVISFPSIGQKRSRREEYSGCQFFTSLTLENNCKGEENSACMLFFLCFGKRNIQGKKILLVWYLFPSPSSTKKLNWGRILYFPKHFSPFFPFHLFFGTFEFYLGPNFLPQSPKSLIVSPPGGANW